MKQILPRLYTIELNQNLWGCRYLSKMKNNLESQGIFIKHPNKKKNNIADVHCLEDSDSIAPLEANFNEMNVKDITKLLKQTIDRQNLVNDQLIHKINEQNFEVSKFKIESEKLFMVEKDKLFKNAPIAATEVLNTGNSFTRLEIFFIVLFLIATILFSVYKAKNIVNSKLDHFLSQRVSRRNSMSTIVTYDNSNMA